MLTNRAGGRTLTRGAASRPAVAAGGGRPREKEHTTARIDPYIRQAVLQSLRLRTADRAQATERVSLGARVVRAQDDVGAAARAARLRAETRGQLRAARNVQVGLTLLGTASTALSTIRRELEQVRQSVEDATDDQLDARTRLETQHKLEQLKDRVSRVIAQTTFNDVAILQGDGGGGDLLAVIEASPVVTDSITVAVPNLQTGAVGGTGTSTLSSAGIRTGADATGALAVIDAAVAEVRAAVARVEALESRLQRSEALAGFLSIAQQETLQKTIALTTHGFARVRPLDQEPPEAAQPRIEIHAPKVPNVPTDVLEATRLSQALIITRSGTSVLTQANVNARSTLRLLEPSPQDLPPFAAALPPSGGQFTLAQLLGLPERPPTEPSVIVR